MKKLLISLTLLSSLAFASNEYNSTEQNTTDDFNVINSLNDITNDLLPNGNYGGTFTTYSGKIVNGRGYSTNNNMGLDLEPLPELCGYTGKLTIDLVLNGNQCSSRSANLHLNEGACMLLRDIPIEFTSCNWDGNHLNGRYKVKPLPFMTGSFNFSKQ